MSGPDNEDLDFQKGDYVVVKESGEVGRIVGSGSQPGWWLVRFDGVGEKEVAEDRLEPTY
jgi:hypothetical protein